MAGERHRAGKAERLLRPRRRLHRAELVGEQLHLPDDLDARHRPDAGQPVRLRRDRGLEQRGWGDQPDQRRLPRQRLHVPAIEHHLLLGCPGDGSGRRQIPGHHRHAGSGQRLRVRHVAQSPGDGQQRARAGPRHHHGQQPLRRLRDEPVLPVRRRAGVAAHRPGRAVDQSDRRVSDDLQDDLLLQRSARLR